MGEVKRIGLGQFQRMKTKIILPEKNTPQINFLNYQDTLNNRIADKPILHIRVYTN